jgi:hypothetical protein
MLRVSPLRKIRGLDDKEFGLKIKTEKNFSSMLHLRRQGAFTISLKLPW